MRLPRVALATAFLLATVLAGPATAAPLTWSPPSMADRFQPFGSVNEIRALACAGDALCVAVGPSAGFGPTAVTVSTSPKDPSAPWSVPQFPSFGASVGIEALECPSTSLCVGMTSWSGVFVTKNPAAAEPAWTRVRDDYVFVPPTPPDPPDLSDQVVALSCPSTTFCAAVDRGGRVTVSNDPGAASPTWTRGATPVLTPAGGGVQDISCASSSLCVVVDGNGAVSSGNPGAGTPVWSTEAPLAGDVLSVSCPTTAFCMTGGTGATRHRSTAPGTNVWSPVSDPVGFEIGGTLTDVACSTASVCTALGNNGTLFTTTDAGAGTPTWRQRPGVLPNGFFGDLVCSTPAFCIASKSAGVATVAANVSSPSPAPTWSANRPISGVNRLTEAECPGETLCVVADDAGRLLSTANPTAPVPTWGAVRPFTGKLDDLSCASTSVCLGVQGNVVRMTRTARAATPTWSPIAAVATTKELDCPAPDLCVVAEGTQAGRLVDLDVVPVLDGPPGPREVGEHTVDGASGLSSLTCPTRTHCAAVDGATDITSTPDVAAADPAWTEHSLAAAGLIVELDCPSLDLCVALDAAGRSWSSSTVFTATPVWNGPVANVGTLLDCPSNGFCLGGAGGAVRATENPAAAVPAWSVPKFAGTSGESLACADDRLCLAGDSEGRVSFGVAVPQSRSVPSVSGAPAVGSALSAAGGAWTGVPATALQWERCDAGGGSCTAIPGATGASYVAVAGDVGSRLRVSETATNAGGSATAASGPSAVVPAPPVPPAAPQPAPPGPAPAPAPPSVRSLLTAVAGVSGASGRLAALVRSGLYRASFQAPSAGVLSVRWLTIPRRGRKAVLLASGRLTVTVAGRRTIVVRLTRAGKRAMRRARRLPIQVRATWTPRSGRPTTVSRRITLRR